MGMPPKKGLFEWKNDDAPTTYHIQQTTFMNSIEFHLFGFQNSPFSQWIYEFAPAALRQTRLVPGDGKHTTHKEGDD